jgi:hypothetical protein
MHGYRDLGGIVQGRKRTYRIDVNIQQPRPGEIRIDPVYVVSTFDNETNKLVKEEAVEVPGDSRVILSEFIAGTKHSAENDFA